MGYHPLTYTTMSTPVGYLLLAVTPTGLCRLSFGEDKKQLAAETQESRQTASALAPYIAVLEAYFNKASRTINLPLDLPQATPWQRRVWEVLRTIPYGETRTYQWVARVAGRPSAARAVGGACRLNPVPIVIPCHRVIRQDGGLGGYASGETIKRKLLELEGYFKQGKTN